VQLKVDWYPEPLAREEDQVEWLANITDLPAF